MKATTIKIEGKLLHQLNENKPVSKSLTAYVKDILTHEVERMTMKEAAAKYAQLLEENPSEVKWLDEWESADLTKPLKKA